MTLVTAFASPALCSIGDQSFVQRNCVHECHSANCSTSAEISAFERVQPLVEYWLMWSCLDECKYACMWRTVDEFRARGLPTPQFHGKWPFARVLGIQEPASAVFSLFNLVPHLFFLRKFRGAVSPTTKMYNVWTMYGVISMNTWVWSTVFHSRDFSFTEKMDYFCAFSIVTYSLLAFLLRLVGTDNSSKAVAATAAAGCAAIFAHHVYNMAFVRFDYGHNMAVNVAVGAVNSVCWLTWSARYRRAMPHVKFAVASVILVNLTILLEVLDFAPFLWTFDSHSLWHLSTAPIHVLWYHFAIADCKHLERMQKSDLADEASKKTA